MSSTYTYTDHIKLNNSLRFNPGHTDTGLAWQRRIVKWNSIKCTLHMLPYMQWNSVSIKTTITKPLTWEVCPPLSEDSTQRQNLYSSLAIFKSFETQPDITFKDFMTNLLTVWSRDLLKQFIYQDFRCCFHGMPSGHLGYCPVNELIENLF